MEWSGDGEEEAEAENFGLEHVRPLALLILRAVQ